MAINPLQLPAYAAPQQADFSSLGQLGQVYRQAQARQTLANLPRSADGQIDTAPLYASGDMTLANLGMQIDRNRAMEGRDARDFQFRQTEAQRAQQNADRSHGLQRDQFGLQQRTQSRADLQNPYMPDPNVPGGVTPTPGNVTTDPAAVARANEIKMNAAFEQRKKEAAVLGYQENTPQYQEYVAGRALTANKQRDLPSGVVKDLNDRGGTYEDFNRLSGGFKDEYGGFATEFAGDTANLAARNLGIGNTERATWWQDYQNQKNIVRNKLFGSALTATEKAEFEKANITIGMTPGIIKANLKLQQDAARRAAAKLANTYSKMGYNNDHIEAALGMPLADVQKPAPAAGAQPPAPASSGGVVDYRSYFGGR